MLNCQIVAVKFGSHIVPAIFGSEKECAAWAELHADWADEFEINSTKVKMVGNITTMPVSGKKIIVWETTSK